VTEQKVKIKMEVVEGPDLLTTNDLTVLVRNFRRISKDRQSGVVARIEQSNDPALMAELKKYWL
jgi:hypothetical protein